MFNEPNAVGSFCRAGQTKAMKARFYNCVYTLLGNQLRGMLSLTIQRYVELFDLENMTSLPQFKLHLCLEGQSMEFFPSIGELESAIVYLVDTVATSMSNLSTIEVSHHPSLLRCSIEGSCPGLALWCSTMSYSSGWS
jgi:hypothetical protein